MRGVGWYDICARLTMELTTYVCSPWVCPEYAFVSHEYDSFGIMVMGTCVGSCKYFPASTIY